MSEIRGMTLEELLAQRFTESRSRQYGQPIQQAVSQWLESLVPAVSRLVQPATDIDDVANPADLDWDAYARWRSTQGFAQQGRGLYG